MSARRPDGERGEDLVARARREELPGSERSALENALETSAALRAALIVGKDFDRAAVARAGDDDLIARAVGKSLGNRAPRAALGKAAPASSRPARRTALSLALAGVLAVTAAGAWTGFVRANHPAARAEGAARVSPSTGDSNKRASGALSTLPAREPSAGTTVAGPSDALEPSASVAPPPPSRLASPPASPLPARTDVQAATTPRDLFRRANAARRDGDMAAARALYLKLQGSFPGSDEARLSHVSLGSLLLATGQAAEADRQLSAYLSSGGGALAEEAMVGRGRCLELLGRRDDERRLWNDLLGAFPSSVYAARARQRLVELAAPAP